jgi:hypothetical protein
LRRDWHFKSLTDLISNDSINSTDLHITVIFKVTSVKHGANY